MLGRYSTRLQAVKTSTKTDDERFICIIMHEVEGGVKVPHPLTRYILDKYRNLSGTTQRNYAASIVDFLNYASTEENIISLSDIDSSVVDNFIQYKVDKGNSRSSIDQMLARLNPFLIYCIEKKLIKKLDFSKHFDVQSVKDGRIYRKYKTDVFLPKRKGKDKLKQLRYELIPVFIDTATKVAPDIALGILFLFYGGLRASEVCNLDKSAIMIRGIEGAQYISLDVKQRMLRNDSFVGNVKQPRIQMVVSPFNGSFKQIYDEHLKEYSGKKGDLALFFNKNGKPMTYLEFNTRFDEVKKAFIKALEETYILNLLVYADTLRRTSWSTHIGRGTFSNMLGDAGLTLNQLAVARGDVSLLSSRVYLAHTDAAIKAIQHVLTKAREDYLTMKKDGNFTNL